MTVAAPKLDTVNDQVRGASSAAPAVGMDSMHIARAVGTSRRRARPASASRTDPSLNVRGMHSNSCSQARYGQRSSQARVPVVQCPSHWQVLLQLRQPVALRAAAVMLLAAHQRCNSPLLLRRVANTRPSMTRTLECDRRTVIHYK